MIKAKVNYEWIRNRINVLFEEESGSKIYIASPIKFIFHESYEGKVIEPTFTLPQQALQSLIDELYEQMNMLPTKLKDRDKYNDKIIETTEKHLQDMRKLVFESNYFIKKPEKGL